MCNTGHGVLAEQIHPTSQRFLDLLDKLAALHLSKSHDYGRTDDPLANIRNGAAFVGIEPWRACVVRLSDKVTRIGTYCLKGTLTHETVEDSFLDLAAYALLSLLLHQEARDESAATAAAHGRRLCPDGAPSEASRAGELLDRDERPTCGRCDEAAR